MPKKVNGVRKEKERLTADLISSFISGYFSFLSSFRSLTASHFSLSFLTASLSFLFLKKRPSRRMKEREVRTSLAVNLSFSLQNSLSLFQRKEEKRESICKRKERESLPGSYQSILSALIFLLTVTTARAWQPSCSLTSCNRLRENSQGFQLPGLKKMFWKMAWSPLTFSFQKGSWLKIIDPRLTSRLIEN